MKSTQLAYPTAQFFEGETHPRTPDPEKSNPENLTKLKLVASHVSTVMFRLVTPVVKRDRP
jgi:hypothetical protein